MRRLILWVGAAVALSGCATIQSDLAKLKPVRVKPPAIHHKSAVVAVPKPVATPLAIPAPIAVAPVPVDPVPPPVVVEAKPDPVPPLVVTPRKKHMVAFFSILDAFLFLGGMALGVLYEAKIRSWIFGIQAEITTLRARADSLAASVKGGVSAVVTDIKKL